MLILKGKMSHNTKVIHTKSDCTQGIDQTTSQNQVYFNFSQFFKYFPGISIMRTDGDKEKFTRPIKPRGIKMYKCNGFHRARADVNLGYDVKVH